MQVPPNSDLTLGMVCLDKATPGRCTWRMTADERFANPAGIMQGGFLGAFADSAMGAAAVTFVQGRKVFAANAEMKISFLAPVPREPCSSARPRWSRAGPGWPSSRPAWWPGPRAATPGPEPTPATDERLVARATSTYIFRERG